MPICKREGFENAPSSNRDETFHDNEDVFYCEVTKEIFRNYDDYFRHVMVINSTVWQCEATGRDNLTYAEALKSEQRARKKMELFKQELRAPVMLVIDHAKQSSLNTLCTLTTKFLRKRYFLNEEVSAVHKTTSHNAYKVLAIIPPGTTVSPTTVYEETENLMYKLERVGQTKTEVIVPFENIRRQRFEFTSENLQMFIKNNVIRVDGILRPKPESFKKYVTDPKITFASLFIGKMPHFTPPKIKQDNNKRQSSINNFLIKSCDEKSIKLTAEELAKLEKDRIEKAEAKAKALRDEMERIRREKQERLLELERQRAEKRRKLLERIEEECNNLLTKTDDLERTDQRLLPTYTPIQTYIPDKLLGDAFVLREFMHSYAGLLSGIEVFRGNLNFFEMSRAFTMREVAGPLSDILLVLLGTIFDLQKEEEEECTVYYVLMRQEMKRSEPYSTMSNAGRPHFFTKRHYSMHLNELPLDALTLSEALRLHLLGSGAYVKDKARNWRLVYRNGYTSNEDPGLALRMQHPHILRALNMYTVYQLPFRDILRILRCLMAQILTYSSPLNLIDERMDEMAKARMALRSLHTAENIRQTGVQTQKRALTNEFHQECIEKDTKSDPQKRVQLEEKLNKKIAELLAQSEREHRKYEQELNKLNEALFNFLVYLGMDRAYRKYYVLESMPGIFIEHPRDCWDTCLNEPPVNVGPGKLNRNELPKTRKDLRSYLMRLYQEEEKKAMLLEKAGTTPNKMTASQENKENQVIQENHVVNGICNGYETTKPLNAESQQLTNGESTSQESSVATAGDTAAAVAAPLPTQYELYMCTGDRHNCIVHDERNRDRQPWSYVYKKEEIDALIDALNPLGERESQLRDQLVVLRELILNHVRKCPIEMLSLDAKQQGKFKSLMLSDTHRKYNESNFGYEQNSDLTTVMHGVLIDRILQFENDISSGHLGRLKVDDMKKWRENLANDAYDAQCVLQWGPSGQKCSTLVAEGADDDVSDEMEDDDEVEVKDGGMYANKPYKDPGEFLGNTLEIDSEDSEEDEISLHDSPTIRMAVRNLASALLQVEQGIERRFIKEPFGAPLKEMKNKELLDRKIKSGMEHLKQWEVSLMECTSYSQIFLHLNILHDAIVWARSTNKSVCMVCRRGSDPEKMLLCDECNGGTHMFCMKPKMKTVPEGNWYCQRCVKRVDGGKGDTLKKKNERRASRRKRMQSDEIESMLESEELESEVNAAESDEELVDIEEETELVEDDVDDEEDSKNQNGHEEKSDTTSTQNEDEIACNVCSYDGCEVVCVRCKGGFHLECIKLKRTPRYIFVCPDCKSKEDSRKRKTKDSDDDDDEVDVVNASRSKRSRVQRSSLRNSLPGEATPEHSRASNHRRSNRRTGDHLPLNSSALYRLLEDIMKHEDAWPFLRPVMQSEVPDYYKIIKHPMDFAKVKSKLNMGNYQLNEEVMNDVQLIFANCDKYNVKGNEVYQAGYELERFVMERCKDLHLPFKPSDMNE